ncbi:MAG: hypothetical protein WCO55_00215 [Candidatus Falkowbacteria bacterium]
MPLTLKKIDKRIGLAYNWLEAQTNKTNNFTEYLYYPDTNRFSAEINYVRIIATTWKQAEIAAYLDKKNFKQGPSLLSYLNQFLVAENDSAYYRIDDRAKAAYNAFAILLLLELDRDKEQEDLLNNLANGLLSLVKPDGSISGDFLKPALGGKNFFPFEAALAMLKYFSQSNNPLFWQAALNIFRYYRLTWPENQNTPMIPWLTHSFCEYTKTKHDPELSEFIFTLNDWYIKQKKYTLKKIPRSSLASFAESMLAAAQLAELYNQTERRERYLHYGNKALRKILKLQCLRDKSELFSSPGLALGGFCHLPNDNQQRCDYTQHALGALHLAAQIAKENNK